MFSPVPHMMHVALISLTVLDILQFREFKGSFRDDVGMDWITSMNVSEKSFFKGAKSGLGISL